jgi:hypothetical protein
MLGISPDGSWVLSPEVVFDESRPDRGAPAVVDLDGRTITSSCGASP